MAEYHCLHSCNKCSGLNKVSREVFEQGQTAEAHTECEECGFEDYWAYGFFESGCEMESKCEKYSFPSLSEISAKQLSEDNV